MPTRIIYHPGPFTGRRRHIQQGELLRNHGRMLVATQLTKNVRAARILSGKRPLVPSMIEDGILHPTNGWDKRRISEHLKSSGSLSTPILRFISGR